MSRARPKRKGKGGVGREPPTEQKELTPKEIAQKLFQIPPDHKWQPVPPMPKEFKEES